ncbi:hypothetical protein K474DRAFT_1657031 [Panus rudis PR-1116 ss-1]|nr:hypothetical protein K474DRAFT_1657031 [Panus rudis PR-1116 ss-1]
MFRASPWVPYDPATEANSTNTTARGGGPASLTDTMTSEDVEMDAPQISTLREDESPEPTPATNRTSKFRVKLLVGEKGGSSSPAKSQDVPVESEDEDEDEDDEEEDQLIDDDDEPPLAASASVSSVKVTPSQPSPAPSAPPSVRGSPAKRGGGRGGRGGRRRGAKTDAPARTGGTAVGATPNLDNWDANTPDEHPPPPVRKRAPPIRGGRRRGGAAAKAAAKAAKGTTAALLRDDAASVTSEPYGGTAASSPMPHDEHSPEPELPPPPSIPPVPSLDDFNLGDVPMPVYPLPTKPPSVQPPPKIATGFAPNIPLDKTKKPVRKWRQVNREVRGIAGGRWFAKAWVGDKESEYASATQTAAQAAAESGMALPKLPNFSSIGPSSGKGTPRAKALKAEASAAGTATSSRAASAGPDVNTLSAAKKRLTGLSESVSTPVLEAPPPVDTPNTEIPTPAPA